MKLVATQPLDSFPIDLAAVAEDLVVLTFRDGDAVLDRYDSRLSRVWQRQLGTKALALKVVHGNLWVLAPDGVLVVGDNGEPLVRFPVQRRDGLQLAAFGSTGDGCLFAWEPAGAQLRCPVIERVDAVGTTLWATNLQVRDVEDSGVTEMSAADGWKPRPMAPWKPQTWRTTSQELLISDDAALACYTEMPRSGIGYGYVVALADGALRFTTKTGPISEVAPLGAGAFLIGYQGYGAFETLRYERDGRISDRWASHGYYLPGGQIRVIEMENVLPSKMHLARLLPGSVVEKGAWLDGYYTSRPFQGPGGATYFFRQGAVVAARDLSIDERLELAVDDGLFSTAAVGGEQGFYFAYSKTGLPGGVRLVRIDL
jgi:hypothetical protein